MRFLFIISIIWAYFYGGFWWITPIFFFVACILQSRREDSKRLKEREDREIENLKMFNYFMDKHREDLKNNTKKYNFPYTVKLCTERKIMDSDEFCPVSSNPREEVEVIELIHEQGGAAAMLAVAPKKNDPKAFWVVMVTSEDVKNHEKYAKPPTHQ